MKAVAFSYHAAASLEEVCTTLAARSDVAKVMGGGQSMGPMLNLRLMRPDAVFDVSRLAELATVAPAGDRIRIGAAVTHAQIEDGVFPELRGTMLQSVAAGFAYRAIRNRGTIGGSIAHADPAADWVVVLTAIGADIEIASASGRRIVPMSQFMLGAYTTALQDGELICPVLVPRHTSALRWGYHKLCRKTGEFAEASCAAYLDHRRALPASCWARSTGRRPCCTPCARSRDARAAGAHGRCRCSGGRRGHAGQRCHRSKALRHRGEPAHGSTAGLSRRSEAPMKLRSEGDSTQRLPGLANNQCLSASEPSIGMRVGAHADRLRAYRPDHARDQQRHAGQGRRHRPALAQH